MITREAGQNITSAQIFLWAGLVALNRRLTWTGWMALLSVLGFSAICAVIWTSSEQIVAWMLSQGVVAEAETSSVLRGINQGARTAGVVGLAIAPLIVLRAVFGFFPWSPLLFAVDRIWKALWPVIGPIVHQSYVVLLGVFARTLLTARFLGKWSAATWNEIQMFAVEIGALAAAMLRLILGLVSTAIFTPMHWAGTVVASAVQRTWAAVYIRLSQLWRWSALLVTRLGQATVIVAQHLGQAISALISPVVSVVVAARQLIERLSNAAAAFLVRFGRQLGSTMSRVWLRFTAATSAVTELAKNVAAAVAAPFLALMRTIASAVVLVLGYSARAAAMAIVIAVVVLGTGLSLVFGLLAKTLTAVFKVVQIAASTVLRPIQRSLIAIADFSTRAMGIVRHAIAVGFEFLGAVLAAVALVAAKGFAAVFVPIWLGTTLAMVNLSMAGIAASRYLQSAASSVRQALDPSILLITALVLCLGRLMFLGARELWSVALAAAATVRILGRDVGKRGLRAILILPMAIWFVVLTMRNGIGAAANVGRAAFWKSKNRKGELRMTNFNLTRQGVISLIATLWILGIAGTFVGWIFWPTTSEPTVEVRHWSTGHLMREGEGIKLLPVMAEQFNKAGYRTKSGTLIEVKVHNVPSELIAEWLVPRVNTGAGIDLTSESDGYVKAGYGEPTIVTPSSAHWLIKVNHEVGRELVDLESTQSLVRPVIGIVTYTEMARCLGWPEKELGFADILALRADPLGWARYDCARPEWGQRPLVAFTDPTTSSTGRSLLLSLYSIAAGIPPEQLTAADVNDPDVAGYVKDFQSLIDHYLIGTTVLNTKIYQGPSYGHFFIMPEDNLIHLYEGTEKALINGVKVTAPPIDPGSMVMIYPKEGSMPRSNCACFVQADWVSPEQVEAGQMWIDFLMEDEQQRNFMSAGFRPGSQISLNDPSSKIHAGFGLDPAQPKVTLNPSLIDPAVAAEIDKNWQLVKRPGIVTFVVDTSGSMLGTKINQARDGLILALGNMAKNNRVGYVAFNDAVHTRVPVAPLAENRFEIADALKNMRARGGTALYDAIKAGIEMSDTAEGPEDAIRAVVVLTDGKANQGDVGLDDLILMSAKDERQVEVFKGFEDDVWAVVAGGGRVEKGSLIGDDLAIETRHPVQVFFIGIGADADLDVGGMLAGATDAEFQGVTEKDLAKVLEEFSKYF